MDRFFSQRPIGQPLLSNTSVLLLLFAGILILAGFSVDYGQHPFFVGSSVGCRPISSSGIRWIDNYSVDAFRFWVDSGIRDDADVDCCSEAFASCGGTAGDEKGSFQLRPFCTVVDYYGYRSTSEGASQKLKAVQQCMDKACPVDGSGQPAKSATTKVKIATTASCTDAANEGFTVQGWVSVSIGGKTFTSNANGVIEADLPPGTYPVNATWKDNVLGYVTLNGIRARPNESGLLTVRLSDKVVTLEVRMLTCDPQGLPKARAVISEIGGTIVVGSKRVTGQAFVGRQLRDGDTVRIRGTAKLNWLDGGGTISFDDPRGDAIIVIGPDSRPAGNKPSDTHYGGPVPSAIEVLQGIVKFIVPLDENKSDPRDEKGEIIKHGASTHTVAVGLKGTIFSLGYDEQTQVSTVIVEQGIVAVTPKNPALRPFDLVAGQEVQVSATNVGAVKGANIWTSNNLAEQYIGCFKDTSAFDLNGYLETSLMNTPQRCIDTCRKKGFKYAGVQYGQSCLCGDSYGKYGPANNCDYKCTGDPSQICGGYAANSIYATEPTRLRRRF